MKLAAFLLILAALIVWPGTTLAQTEAVRIALPKTLIFLPVFAAEALDLYAEAGVRVEFLTPSCWWSAVISMLTMCEG